MKPSLSQKPYIIILALIDLCDTLTFIDDCTIEMTKNLSEKHKYKLSYLPSHLYEIRDRKRLWRFLRDERIRRDQLRCFGHFQESYRALELGLRLYAEQEGQDPEDDPRLCWLALRSSRLADEATTDYASTVEHVESSPLKNPKRISEALERFAGFSQEELLPALLLLIWIEIDRAREVPIEQRDQSGLWEILTSLEERIPGSTVDWSQHLSQEFITWLGLQLITVFATDAINRRQLEKAYFQPLIRMLDGDSAANSHFRASLACELARVRIFGTALEVTQSIDEDFVGNRARGNIAEQLINAGHDLKALQLLEQAPSDIQDELRFILGLRSHSQQRFGDADSFAGEIENSELCSRLLTDRALCLVRLGHLKEAQVHFARALRVAPRPYDDLEGKLDNKWILPGRIGAILRVAWSAGIRDQTLWQKLWRPRDHQGENQTLYVVVAFLAEVGYADRAMAVFDVMNSHESWKPEALVEIAQCLVRQNRADEAQDILTKALEAAQDEVVSRRTESLAAVASGFVTNGDLVAGASIFRRSILTLEQMRVDYSFARAARRLFSELGGKEYFPGRTSLLGKALASLRHADDNWWRAKSLPTATQAILRARVDEPGRQKLLDELLEIAADTFTSGAAEFREEVIQTLVDVGHIDRAERLAARIPDRFSGAYSELASRLAATGERQRVAVAFRAAFDEATPSPETFQKIDPLQEVLRCMATSGFSVDALAMSRTLESPRLRRLAASIVLPEIARKHGSRRARRVFLSFLRMPRMDVKLDFRSLSTVASELVRLQKPINAIQLLHQGLPESVMEDQEDIGEALYRCLKTLDEIPESIPGKQTVIRLLVDITSRSAPRKEYFRMILGFLINSGELEFATKVAGHIDNPICRADSLGLVARGWCDQGVFDRGGNCFHEALGSIKGQIVKRNPPQALIARHLVDAPPFPSRDELLATALTDSAQLDMDSDKADALAKVTRAILEARYEASLHEAIEHAQRLIEETGVRHVLTDIQIDLCGAMARSELLVDALALARDLKHDQTTHAEALTSIVLALGKRGELSSALDHLSEITDEWRRSYAASCLGELLETGPQPDQEVQDTFHRLFTIVGAIGDEGKRLEALVSLAQSANRSIDLLQFREFLTSFLVSIDAGVAECRRYPGTNNFLESAVELWTLLGDVESALGVIAQHALKDERTGAYRALTTQLLDMAEDPNLPMLLPSIEDGVSTMDDRSLRIDALVNLALSYDRIGDARAALHLVNKSLETSYDLKADWDRQRSLSTISGKCSDLTSFPWTSFVSAVCTLDSVSDQEAVLSSLARSAARQDNRQETLESIADERIANSARRAFVLAWQEALSSSDKASRPHLRRSLTLFPFETNLGVRSVQIYLEHCLRCDESDLFFSIIRLCNDLPFAHI